MKYGNDNKITFETTGRQVFANCGLIGIGQELEVVEGYDGEFCENDVSPLNKTERVELADYMIGLWQQYKDMSR